jgi:hypothetical protein
MFSKNVPAMFGSCHPVLYKNSHKEVKSLSFAPWLLQACL